MHKVRKWDKNIPFLAPCLHNPHLLHITQSPTFHQHVWEHAVSSFANPQLVCWARSELISPQHTLLLSRSSCFYISGSLLLHFGFFISTFPFLHFNKNSSFTNISLFLHFSVQSSVLVLQTPLELTRPSSL